MARNEQRGSSKFKLCQRQKREDALLLWKDALLLRAKTGKFYDLFLDVHRYYNIWKGEESNLHRVK